MDVLYITKKIGVSVAYILAQPDLCEYQFDSEFLLKCINKIIVPCKLPCSYSTNFEWHRDLQEAMRLGQLSVEFLHSQNKCALPLSSRPRSQ